MQDTIPNKRIKSFKVKNIKRGAGTPGKGALRSQKEIKVLTKDKEISQDAKEIVNMASKDFHKAGTDQDIDFDAGDKSVINKKGVAKEQEFIGKQAYEREFFAKFNEIMQIDKDKDIRMFRCIGDPDFSKEQNSNVENERLEYNTNQNNEIEYNGTHRFEKILDYDLPIYEAVMPYYKSSWNTFKNDALKMRKLRLKKFMKCATKIVMRLRADKRLFKIKNFLGAAKNRDDVKRLVIQDWQRADYLGSGKTNFVKFDFEFSEINVGFNSLPIQHDNKIDMINFQYDASIQIGFDDLSKINDLKENDAELLTYKGTPPSLPLLTFFLSDGRVQYPPVPADQNRRALQIRRP
jgi:hypothetical protein